MRRLLFLGSSCIYLKFAVLPICEEALLICPLEPTNRSYTIAKIAGLSTAPHTRSVGPRVLLASTSEV